MEFGSIFREERHYCAHLFRLLCFDKEAGGEASGLAGFLKLVSPDVRCDARTIAEAQVFAEVAVFRDFYHVHEDRAAFLSELYDAFLPLVLPLYGGKIGNPIRPDEFDLRTLHPRDFGGEIGRRPARREADVLFYREFSALFNAKPDLLIICDQRMFWFEVKFWVAFDSRQLQRTRHIAALCSSPLFAPLFSCYPGEVVKLGTHRHRAARKDGGFTDWADVAQLAEKVLPGGESNYSVRALRSLISMDLAKGSSDRSKL